MDAVDRAPGQSTHDGAVHADVLQIVAGVLLDQPDRALGAERAHAVLDEARRSGRGGARPARSPAPSPSAPSSPRSSASSTMAPARPAPAARPPSHHSERSRRDRRAGRVERGRRVLEQRGQRRGSPAARPWPPRRARPARRRCVRRAGSSASAPRSGVAADGRGPRRPPAAPACSAATSRSRSSTPSRSARPSQEAAGRAPSALAVPRERVVDRPRPPPRGTPDARAPRQRPGRAVDQALVPALCGARVERGARAAGASGCLASEPPHPRDAAPPPSPAPARSTAQRADGRVARSRSGRRDAPGAAGQQARPGRSARSPRARTPREDAVADHGAHARGHELPVRGDERRVRDRQPERAAEDRGDREPVGEPADDARLGDGEDPAAPPRRAERERDDRQPGGAEQDAEGEPPLARHAQRPARRKSSMRSVADGPGGHVWVARRSPPLQACPMPGTSHVSST